MDIIQLVNHYWPNTIAKLALEQQYLPDGIPFMGAYVQLFDGASLPAESDVSGKAVDYDAYIATQTANQSIKQQIIELEATITLRRRDEAILGTDNGWLANTRTQIATLRGQLQ